MMEVQAKGQKLLMITGIIYIVVGALAALGGIIGVMGVVAIPHMDAQTLQIMEAQWASQGMTMEDATGTAVIMTLVIAAIAGVLSVVAGIMGVVNRNKPAKAQVCIIMGAIILTLDMATAGYAISQGTFLWWSTSFSAILAVCYLYGGILNKQSAK